MIICEFSINMIIKGFAFIYWSHYWLQCIIKVTSFFINQHHLDIELHFGFIWNILDFKHHFGNDEIQNKWFIMRYDQFSKVSQYSEYAPLFYHNLIAYACDAGADEAFRKFSCLGNIHSHTNYI